MPGWIHTITLRLPLGLGSVNAYLLRSGGGFVLIDTGPPAARVRLERALGQAGCALSDLRLTVLTHGDFDHTGNACHLRKLYAAPIAIHRLDASMLQEGDMFSGRKQPNFFIRWATSKLFGFGRSEQCAPDIHLEDAMSLHEYGFDAHVIHLPGHSSGSVGILTSEGDLFCGDLLENRRSPATSSLVDNASALIASLERIRGLGIRTVYPGHGDPFPMESFQLAHPTGATRPSVDR